MEQDALQFYRAYQQRQSNGFIEIQITQPLLSGNLIENPEIPADVEAAFSDGINQPPIEASLSMENICKLLFPCNSNAS